MAVRARMTADELFRYQPPDKDTELIRGRMIVREPPQPAHGRCAANLCFLVTRYVREHSLGAVYAQDTGFQIEHDPDTVLAPDLAFITRDRLHLVTPNKYGQIAPDLVAEILSPTDRRRRVVWKMEQWVKAGVQVAWMIEPKTRVASMYFPDGSVVAVPSDGTLTGGTALPGFSCTLADVFDV